MIRILLVFSLLAGCVHRRPVSFVEGYMSRFYSCSRSGVEYYQGAVHVDSDGKPITCG